MMKKHLTKTISTILVVVLLLLIGPAEGLLEIRDVIGDCFINIAKAAANSDSQTTTVIIKDFSANTHIERVTDRKSNSYIHPNGGYETYDTLRRGKKTAKKKNGEIWFVFTKTTTVMQGFTPIEKKYVVEVPLSAFTSPNVGTSFESINQSLSYYVNSNSVGRPACLYKSVKDNGANAIGRYRLYMTWLTFSGSRPEGSINLQATANGHVSFEFHPWRIFGNKEKPLEQIPPRAPQTEEEYAQCLLRWNDSSVHELITPAFDLLVCNQVGGQKHILQYSVPTVKGYVPANKKDHSDAIMDSISFLFGGIDAIKDISSLYAAPSPDGFYRVIKDTKRIAESVLDKGKKYDEGFLILKYNAKHNEYCSNELVDVSDYSQNRLALFSKVVSPAQLGKYQDTFQVKYYLSANRNNSKDAYAKYAVEFSVNEPIVTSAKTYTSGNYIALESKKEISSATLFFNSLSANSSAQANSTVKTILSGTIKNTDKQKIVSYGFYLKAKSSAFTSSDAVGKNNNATTNASINVQYNTNSLQPDTLYYYRVFAKTANNTYYSKTQSFRTPKVKPKDTQITSVKALDYKTNAETSSAELGVGDNIKVKWNKAAYADYYTIKINGVEDKTKVYGTEKIIKLTTVGQNTVSVCAHNSVGSSAWTSDSVATVHENVTVSFLNGDETSGYSEVASKEVVWNHCVDSIPVSPSKVGGAFSGWFDQNDDLFTRATRIKEDQEIKSKYARNSYKVKFVDGNGNPLAVTLNPGTENEQTVYEQTVYYGQAAVAPDTNTVPVPNGYHFLGWDADFSNITTSLTIKAVADFDNYNIPVLISDASAMRYPNRYVVNCTIKNRLLKNTNGRIIVALKNSAGRLITTTESYAYYIDANQTITNEAALNSDTVKIFVPIDTDMEVAGLVADYAEIYLVKDFKSTVPVGEHYTVGIENCDPWSAWSETPSEEYLNAGSDRQEHKTQYQYRDLQTTTAATYEKKTELVQQGWTWDQSTAKTGTPTKSAWSTTKPATAENREIKSRQQSKVTGYRYKRYEYKNTSNNKWYYTYGSSWATNHGYSGSWKYLQRNTKLTYHVNSYTEGNKTIKSYSESKDTKYDYWFEANCNTGQGKKDKNGNDYTIFEVKTNFTEYQAWDYPYTLTKWPDAFTEWSDEAVTEIPGTRELRTRELYRYYIGLSEPKASDDSEQVRTDYTFGNIGSENAGKQAILFIYKINEASDWTTEYVAQTVIDAQGNYSFDPYILRENPTAQTGDYTVALAVEGAQNQIYLGKIEVPDSEYVYTVTYVDPLNNNAVISEQQVMRGNDAQVPDAPLHEGYTFSHWDMRSTNIQFSTVINAQYNENQYTVVYYNPQNEVSPITIDYVKHGESLTPPDSVDTDELEFVGWDALIDGISAVTSDLIVTAMYKPHEYNVVFCDIAETNYGEGLAIAETQTVEYGETPEEPNASFDGVTFLGWALDSEDNEPISLEEIEVTEDTYLSPVYYYEDTVATPTTSLPSGSYDSLSSPFVQIDCETAGAKILFTTDGSDPISSETAHVVNSGIRHVLNYSCILRVVAIHDNMNRSIETDAYYVINNGTEPEKRIVRLGSWNSDTEYGMYAVETGSLLNSELFEQQGYVLNGVYRNYELNETTASDEGTDVDEETDIISYNTPWDLSTEVINQDTTLYLDYSPILYSVRFVDYDGELIDEQQVAYENSATDPGAPDREGYRFNGWNADFTSITEDTTITATYVLQSEYPSITLNRKKYKVMEGSQTVLYATTENTETACEWISSDASVATVSDGVVDAVNEGAVEISAFLPDSGEVATCLVTVVTNTDYSIELKTSSQYLFREAFDSGRILMVNCEKEGITVDELLEAFVNDALVILDKEGNRIGSSEIIGTGTTVNLVNNDEILDSICVVIPGDLDGNGVLTDRDAELLSYITGDPDFETNDLCYWAADFNQDYVVDQDDYDALWSYLHPPVTEGQCGDHVYWEYNCDTNVLNITGYGDMWDISIPWKEYRKDIKAVAIENGVSSISSCAFEDAVSLREISLPNSLKSIGERCFANAFNLSKITLGNSLENIGMCAFQKCTRIEEIILPDSVRFIGHWAFEDCVRLKTISLPSELSHISAGLFLDCLSLETVEIPSSVNEIDTTYVCPFAFCLSLNTIINHSNKLLTADLEYEIRKAPEEVGQNRYIQYFIISRDLAAEREAGVFSWENYTDEMRRRVDEESDISYDEFMDLMASNGGLQTLNKTPKDILHICNKHSLDHEYCKENSAPYELICNGHEFGDWVVINEATTETEGLMQRECIYCEEVVTKSIPKITTEHQHTYTSTITKKPTCKEEGVMTYTCTVCDVNTAGHTKTEAIGKDLANHASYGTVLKNKVEATCTEKGCTGDTVCNGCRAIISKGKEVPALGHTEPDSNGKCTRCNKQLVDPTDPTTQPQPQPQNICKWCGKTHEGFFQGIIGFFHKILAAILGAKY